MIQKASLGCLAAGTGHRVYPDRAQRTAQADERQRRAAANFPGSRSRQLASDLILGSWFLALGRNLVGGLVSPGDAWDTEDTVLTPRSPCFGADAVHR